MTLRPAIWLLARLTGWRLRHLVVFALALASSLAAVGAGAWWLAERADSTLGAAGVLLVLFAYLVASAGVVVLCTILAGRLLLVRARRSLASLTISDGLWTSRG